MTVKIKKMMKYIKEVPTSQIKYDLIRIYHKEFYDNKRENVREIDSDKEGYKYSMKVFDETESIFIHVPKCAGMSVALSLYGCLAGGHTTADEYRVIFGHEFFEYYTFSIVRNPYDRLVSAYEYITNKEHEVWPENEKTKRSIKRDCICFKDFVEKKLNTMSKRKYHFMPQSKFIKTEGKVCIDKIIKFENLSEDFKEVKRKINPNASLMQKNKNENRKIYQHYYDKKTISKVKKIYEEDFETFNYRFEIS